MIEAAQYIRMSTDRQDLSPAIQKEAISAYAHAHGIEVVASYEDLGKSGLRLANRSGMTRLLIDVAAHPCFSLILVYDVSRWGRFQDSDASAYYDYHCRLNGVSVVYVAETFGDGISPIAALAKGMKRLMAAEYSKDLASKCVAGQERVLAMGFQIGSPPCLGYRRESVSADGMRRVLLAPGQSKFSFTDRIHWVLSGEKEVALVRLIFDIYANTACTVNDVAERAFQKGWVDERGRPLTSGMIKSLLKNEAVIGNFVWGRSTQRRFGIVKMDLHRLQGAVPGIVDASTWALAQAKLKSGKRIYRTKDVLIGQLKFALQRNPDLTAADLAAHGCGTKCIYTARFGSWPAALEATGVDRNRLVQNGVHRSQQRRAMGYSFGHVLEGALIHRGMRAHFDGRLSILRIRCASIRIRLLWPRVNADGSCLWHVEGYQSIPEVGRVLLVRMEPAGVVLDYFLVDLTALAAGFPQWLVREVPVDLHAYWSPSRPLVLNRLASLRHEDASVAARPDTFSALALARHRHRLGLTATQCGALIGASTHSIFQWESELVRPSSPFLEAIARFQRLGKKEAAARLRALIP